MASGLPSSFAVGCPSVALFLLFFQLGTTAVGSPFIVLCCITRVIFSHRMSTSFSLLYTQSLVLLQCLSFCSASLNVLVALFSSSRASSSAAFLLLLCFGFGGSRPELGLQLAAITTTVLSDRSVWCTRQCPLWKIYAGEPYSDSAQYMRAHECS